MLRRRIKSALYIDFENVPLPPEAIGNWLAWLEDGVFDAAGQRRRFLQKRVYWNSHAERNRDLFQKHGFVPILIGKYSGLKNGADIRMAMDIVETTYTRAEIDEFILLTGDSDFVPVLERLKHKAKRSAIVATEHRPNIHTTYHRNAEILIPSRRLTEAAQYQRRRPSFIARILGAKHRVDPKTEKPLMNGEARSAARARIAKPPEPPVVERVAADPPSVLETAARRVVKLLTQQPRNYVAQKRVLAELDRVQSFKRQGPNAYLGAGSYKTLMQELARLEPRIMVVDQPGGGTGVVYIPPQAKSEAENATVHTANGETMVMAVPASSTALRDTDPNAAPHGSGEIKSPTPNSDASLVSPLKQPPEEPTEEKSERDVSSQVPAAAARDIARVHTHANSAPQEV
ncbi:MAG: NYN domain-containing protein [Hyphomicrobiaceae bacterium]